VFTPLVLTRAEAMRRLKLSNHRWPLLQALVDLGLIHIGEENEPEPVRLEGVTEAEMQTFLRKLREAGMKVVSSDS
jgi:hypothetical protein